MPGVDDDAVGDTDDNGAGPGDVRDAPGLRDAEAAGREHRIRRAEDDRDPRREPKARSRCLRERAGVDRWADRRQRRAPGTGPESRSEDRLVPVLRGEVVAGEPRGGRGIRRELAGELRKEPVLGARDHRGVTPRVADLAQAHHDR